MSRHIRIANASKHTVKYTANLRISKTLSFHHARRGDSVFMEGASFKKNTPHYNGLNC